MKKTASWRNSPLDIAIAALSIAALGLLHFFVLRVVPEAFELRFNAFSLISAAGFCLNAILLVVLIRRSNRSNSVLWFALFILMGMLWSGAEALARSAATPAGAVFWGGVIIGVTPFMPAYFYLFVRSYTSKAKALAGLWVPVTVIGTAVVIGAILAANVSQVPGSSALKPWGYSNPGNDLSLIIALWGGTLIFAAIGCLIAFYRRSTTANDRKLAVIFMISAATLVTVSTFTEVLLPKWGIAFPPLGVFSNALLALGVIIGIYKYGSFSVGLDEIADTVLSNMAGGVVVTDLNYLVLYCNQRAVQLVGSGGRDLTGQDLRTIGLHRLGDAHYEWEQTLKDHPIAEIPGFALEHDGDALFLDLKVTNLQADQPGYVFVMNDVTKQKLSEDSLSTQTKELASSNEALQQSQAAMMNLLEDARELEDALKREKAGVEQEVQIQTTAVKAERSKLEAALNGLDVSVYMIDEALDLVYANDATQQLFAAMSKRPWSPADFIQSLKSEPAFRRDIEHIQRKHKSVEHAAMQAGNRTLRVYMSPVLDPSDPSGPILGIVGSVQDITEAKADERSRDEFFSIASHELRTPLTAIRGNTSMIQDYFADQIKDPTLKEMIGDIHNSSIRLITIVNDFLNTSRLEQGKIEFKLEPISPADLIEEVIKEFRAGDSGAKVPIQASLKEVPDILADRDRLKEVLINLIANAVKFTDTGVITVGLGLDGKQVKLSVTDTGKGIPQESQGLLFRKFQQASNNILTRDSTRSTGLGLYISKLMVIGMGGKIFLERSEADLGSTFTVLVPAAKPAKVKPVTKRKL